MWSTRICFIAAVVIGLELVHCEESTILLRLSFRPPIPRQCHLPRTRLKRRFRRLRNRL